MKLDELAKLSGVSRTTVSYVLNGKAKKHRVSDKTIEKVTALIEKYQFKPNAMAAGLRAGKTNTIGLIIPDFENISYARIANTLENYCRQRGYQLIITCSNDNPENEIDCAKNLFQRKVDALIVSTSLSPENTFYLENSSVPIISFDRLIGAEQMMNVHSDDKLDAYDLAEQFFKQSNMKKVLYLGALPNLTNSIEREIGFRQSLAAQTDIKVDFIYADYFHKERAELACAKWFEKNELPDGIFVTSLSLLQGMFQFLLRQNKIIPKDLIIATFGNHEMLGLLPNKIICSMQRYEKISQTLLELILHTLKDRKLLTGKEIIRRELIFRNCE